MGLVDNGRRTTHLFMSERLRWWLRCSRWWLRCGGTSDPCCAMLSLTTWQGQCTRALYTLGERTTTDMGARGRRMDWAGKSGGGKSGSGDILLVLD